MFKRALRPFVGLGVVLAVILIYQLAAGRGSFFTAYRFQLIAKQSAFIAMGSLGMTVIIIAGGIDLAAGSLVAVASVTLAIGLREGLNPAFAVFLAIAAGGLAGALNGTLITRLKLAPFIVTLGTMSAFRGLAEQIAHQQNIAVSDAPAWCTALLASPQIPPGHQNILWWLRFLLRPWQWAAPGVWVVVLLALGLAAVLRLTVFGRHVFAIGGNETAARLSGVYVNRTKILVYALGGLFFALAGIYSFCELGNQGDPGAGLGKELDMIAAAVIGGASLSGGRGSELGALIGAVTMTAIRSGCTFAQVSDPLEKIIVGAIIIGAVAIDRLAQPSRT